MKQLLYFLIGFSVILFPVKYLYSYPAGQSDCYPAAGNLEYQVSIPTGNNYESITSLTGVTSGSVIMDGIASSSAAALARAQAWLTGLVGYGSGFTTLTMNDTRAGLVDLAYGTGWRSSVASISHVSFWYRVVGPYSVLFPFYNTPPLPEAVICPPSDSDGDGIPDDCDIYPDDPTPYKIRTYSYQTSENTFGGTKTYQWIHTDRGQTYELGTKDSTKSDFLTYSSPWEDPPTTCSGINTNPENTEPIPENNPFTTDAPTGEPSETDTDPAFQPGEVSDGTETGDPLLRDIKTNTGKIATNTDRLGDYMKELTKAVQGMDRNTAKIASGGTGTGTGTGIGPGDQAIVDALGSGNAAIGDMIGARDQANNEQAQGDKSAFEGLNDDGHEYDGTLEEGVDYDPASPLEEETWLSDFINDNPIKEWIDNSGFDTTGGVCSLSFVHPRYGSLSFSLCQFESTFIAAGNILVGLCSLYGLILIIKG